MRSVGLRNIVGGMAAGLGLLLLVAAAGLAQSGGPRNLEQLKTETQRRVDHNLAPATGLKSDDAREALANIHSLDRDEWAAAWSAIADRYAGRAAADSDKNKQREDYLMAWRY